MAAITIPHQWIKPGESFNAQMGAAPTATGSSGAGGWACVIQGASTGLVIESAGEDIPLGFIQEESATVPAINDQVAVFFTGIIWAVSGAAIAYMAECMSATGGRVITATTGLYCVGICLDATAGAGERFPLMIRFCHDVN